MLLLHSIILGGIVQSLPVQIAGLHGTLMIPAVGAEGGLILVALWVRSVGSDSDTP